MKRAIRRTKGELEMRKALLSHLLSLGKETLTGLGDTERRIQERMGAIVLSKGVTPDAIKRRLTRLFCTAAWFHPAGSAMMYLHYREVSKKRSVPENLERWGVKLMLGAPTIAEALYGGSWKVLFERKEEESS